MSRSRRKPQRDDGLDFTPVEVPRDEDIPGTECFRSSRYQVLLIPAGGGWTWLSIKRTDKSAMHDWRELQRIKTVLCGGDREALELYPAEDRVVDTSNQYHLWVMPPGERFPFGWTERAVLDGNGKTRPNYPRQRPLPSYMEPTHTHQQAAKAIKQLIIEREGSDEETTEGSGG